MHRSVVDGGFAPDVLHYVDLTALRPVYAVDIGAEHPKGRPHSLPFGKFDACFDLAVLDFVFPLSLQPRGRVLARRRLAAGITGLTAAFYLKRRNVPVTVYEAAD